MAQPECRGWGIARPDIQPGSETALCNVCHTRQRVIWENGVAKLVRHHYPEKKAARKTSYAAPWARSKKKHSARKSYRRSSPRR
jgi:hypothetical protein